MNNPHRTRALATAAFLALLTSNVSAQEATPASPAKINPADAQKAIAKLKELREQRTGLRQNALQAGMKRISEALATETGPLQLWEDCIKAERYTGVTDNLNGEFRDWKDRSKDTMKDDTFRQCLRAHLQYLSLSLEYLSLQDTEPQKILPKLDNYMSAVPALRYPDRSLAHDLMEKSLKDSVFVQNLNLDAEIGKLKEWEAVPAKIGNMEKLTYLPLLRKHYPEQVIPYWDRKIQRESAANEKERLASRVNDFRNQRLPNLQWGRAEELVRLGQAEAGYKAMFQIVSANPAHPNFPEWANTLEEYLKASLPMAPATSQEAAPATPPTAEAAPRTEPTGT